MNNREMLGLLDTYYRLSVLKHKERSGWVEWNVIARRLESVAEHVFSVQQLAYLFRGRVGFRYRARHFYAFSS